jgi:hypothetical protein
MIRQYKLWTLALGIAIELSSIALCSAQNPIIQTNFTADPASPST